MRGKRQPGIPPGMYVFHVPVRTACRCICCLQLASILPSLPRRVCLQHGYCGLRTFHISAVTLWRAEHAADSSHHLAMHKSCAHALHTATSVSEPAQGANVPASGNPCRAEKDSTGLLLVPCCECLCVVFCRPTAIFAVVRVQTSLWPSFASVSTTSSITCRYCLVVSWWLVVGGCWCWLVYVRRNQPCRHR